MKNISGFLILLVTLIFVGAKPNIDKVNDILSEAVINPDGTTISSNRIDEKEVKAELLNTLMKASPTVEKESAIELAAVIEAASTQDYYQFTTTHSQRIKDGPHVAKLKKDYDESQIVIGMESVVKEMKMLGILFRGDPQRAFAELLKADMIDKSKLSEYKENPELLEEDTRKNLWYNFITLAYAGGHM